MTAVDLPAGVSGAVPTFTWRLDGLIAARTWSGTAATFGYDAAKRPTAITKGSLSLGQAYDRDGNVTADSRSFPSVSGDAGSGSQSFSYDALNRVTGSSGLAQARSYTYDRDGNRRTRTVGADTWTYVHDRTDQLVSVQKNALASQSFGYDAYGNLTADAETGTAVTAMTYDLADRLTSIDASGSTNDTTFTLDALGRFRTRAVAGVSDTYSYVGASETVARIATAGGTTLDSVVSPAGDRLAVTAGTTLNWLVPDLHGNVAASLDASEATMVNATRYDAWGETIGTGSAGGTAVGAGAWKYQGRLDVSPAGLSTPLYDMSARFYAPGIAAFTSLDSVMGAAQDPLSMNRFLYAEANPATLIDPTGHAAVWGGGSSSKTLAEAKATKVTWQRSTIRYRKSKACQYDERCGTNRGRRYTSGKVRTAGVDTPAQVRKQKLLGVLRTQAIRQQRAHDSGGFDIGAIVHTGLDAGGMVPLFGAIPDLVNAGYYGLEGDFVNAGLAGAAAVPFIGDPIGGTKLAVKYGDDVAGFGIGIFGKHGDEVAETAGKVCSFTPDTTVATPDGDRPIAELDAGDRVLARSESTGATSVRAVSAVLRHDDAVTGTVVIDGERIETTPEHPFFSLDRGFVAAEELRVGELVATASGVPGEVHSVTWDGGPAEMWNLTVEVDHTFFVGEGRAWVHNRCPTDNFKHALDDDHLRAAQGDLAGSPIRRADGSAFDHLTEVTNAQRGLLNRIGQIKRELSSGRLSFSEQHALTEELGEASRLLDHSEDFLRR